MAPSRSILAWGILRFLLVVASKTSRNRVKLVNLVAITMWSAQKDDANNGIDNCTVSRKLFVGNTEPA